MSPSEPTRWSIRRTAAILAASLLLLVVAGAPAWAGASIAPAEVTADTDQGLTLTVTEPEDEAYGDTAHVRVGAPKGFTVLSCGSTPEGWSCTMDEDGTGLTLTRVLPLALADTRDFGFTVHTPAVNGQYAFRVVQADGPPSEEEPPATVSSRPAVTVTGGRDPEPEPTPPADDGGSQTGTNGSTDGDAQGDGTEQDAGTADGGDTEAGADETSTEDGTSGGSTAPRRTQGRTSGTTLEITPGEPTGDDPDVAPPDVADDPAIAPPDDGPTDGSTDSAAAAATGTQASGEPGGTPWQQWVGAAMLLAGLAAVGGRWLWHRRT